MNRYTKPPWSIRCTDVAIWSGHLSPVISYKITPEAISLGEIEANARLIAAAPELYEALESCKMMIDRFRHGAIGCNDHDLNEMRLMVEKADEILKKAIGEESE